MAFASLAAWFIGMALSAPDSKPQQYPRPDLLVEAADLAKPQAAQRFRMLDARPRGKYLEGHVPGAVWVDHSDWMKGFSGEDREAWQKRIGDLGIDLNGPVIVYDDNRAKDAARIWWILRYWGARDARLLNGGWSAWRAAGGPVETTEPAISRTTPRLEPQPGRLAHQEEILDSLKERRLQLVDARSREEFCGEAKTAKRNGAIPGALHREWSDLLDPKTDRFKSPAELKKLLKESGIDRARPVVTYCQSGGRAAVMAFALELMGAKDVRNYYRSWAEWGNSPRTPVVKPAPQ